MQILQDASTCPLQSRCQLCMQVFASNSAVLASIAGHGLKPHQFQDEQGLLLYRTPRVKHAKALQSSSTLGLNSTTCAAHRPAVGGC